MTTIVKIPAVEKSIDSKTCSHVVNIYGVSWHEYKKQTTTYVPENHDVVSIELDDIPKGLERIDVYVGNMSIFAIDAKDIKARQNILDQQIPYSKAYYMTGKLVFHFEKDYLEAHEEFEWIDEMRMFEEYSDHDIEVFDGYEYHIGREVKRRHVPTGNLVKHIVRGYNIKIPAIKIGTVQSTTTDEDTVVNIIQRFHVYPEIMDVNYVRNLVVNHGLQPIDGSDIEAALTIGQPFWCHIKNRVRFHNGIAGMMYLF